MYLSKLVINTHNPMGVRSIVNPYETHRTVWQGFPNAEDGGPGRVLFRLEATEKKRPVVVLVQSGIKPDWHPLLNDDVLVSAQCKPFNIVVPVNTELRFRLKANPTARKIVDESQRDENGRPKRGRVQLFSDKRQMEWLRGKAEKGGFRVIDCRVSEQRDYKSRKQHHGEWIKHYGVTFDGILQVTDSDLFQSAVSNGIGSAKGFGFGLLSIAPYQG